jgi:CheY-like chemotaxis protein
VAVLSTTALDAALVDWNMPGGGGRRVVDVVAAGEVPPVRLVLITGMPEACLPPEAARWPILQKPFRVRELERVLESPSPSGGRVACTVD